MKDSERTKWTDDDFASMVWHDNHVHSMRFAEGEHLVDRQWHTPDERGSL